MINNSFSDVVVVGAGAAGVGAARALRARGFSVVVLESRGRAGGRASTVIAGSGHPIDLGCGWLHSADVNPLTPLARALGFTVDETTPPWRTGAESLGFAPGDYARYRAAQERFYERLEAAAQEETDAPAASLLEPGERWAPLLNAVSTYVNGVELDRLSIKDFDNYADTEINFRVAEGYGALIARLAADLPVAYDTPVRAIDHAGPRVRVETDRGAVEARAAIVTLPTNVIASGAVRFSPAADDALQAASRLPLGLADKIYFEVSGAEALPDNARLFGAVDRACTGAYHYRPFGRPLIEGYFGGACARALEAEGPAAFAAFALDELVNALGSSWRARLTPVAMSAWARDPHALGSYSHALPGHWDERAKLARPVGERLFFAGEATSPHFFSTAHGAWESGERAAGEAAAFLSAP
ncbi:MAG TPA: NAD(P)/FAD-dependent oxidoreductase [Beijerinckiaceae bacterium]